MSKGIFAARLMAMAGFWLLPALAADQPAQTRSCWLRDLASPVPTTVFALCEQGTVWISTDSGATWTAKETGASEPVRAMAFLDANRGITVGDAGLVLTTADGGKTWTKTDAGTDKKLMDIAFVGNSG